MFGFQQLEVYQYAIRFLASAHPLADAIPRGNASLADQLRRAAISVPLNIAEGSGRHDRDARRFYSIARGSALECAAVLDVIEATKLVQSPDFAIARQTLLSVVRMLTKMARIEN